MAAKKKRSAKQIAATKKLIAFNKRRRKANPVKKKKAVGRKSQATGKRPNARLKARRSKKRVKGYYPNPIFYVAYVPLGSTKYYYHGYSSTKKRAIFDDNIEGALWYRTRKQARDEATAMGKRTKVLSPKHTIATEIYHPK